MASGVVKYKGFSGKSVGRYFDHEKMSCFKGVAFWFEWQPSPISDKI